MAKGDNLSIGVVSGQNQPQYMPNIFSFSADDKRMAPEDLILGDILVVYWKDSENYKTETSVVRFEKFGEGTRFDQRRVVFLCRADFEPLSACCYPLKDISEMRFCARDSSASSQIFFKLHELYKENRILTEKLETIRKRFMKFVE